ncbi:hypothetical protein F8M41_008399 [Gigaspora margarita]|uniref:Uncharacterized protein n=1 Tax=Gigaspora margarita TaxID=4874 RepID=A0A8H3X677_GIGMA|nr:hypothetical protein F8M41_008399 [Gigaspora margarita]
MAKAIKKNSSKPKSSCRKTKSKSKSKTKNKKSSKRVNAHIISDESSLVSSDSENSTTSSENELEPIPWHIHGMNQDLIPLGLASLVIQKAIQKNTNSKDTRPLKIPTDNISLNAFFAILRSMVDSFTRTQSKEVSINGYNMINAKFIALKDPVLNHFTSNFSDKEREKFWHEITMIFSPFCNQYQI